MINVALIVLPILFLVITGLFPRTKWNQSDSFNSLFSVRMRPVSYYKASGESIKGVHAQERVECFLRWFTTLSIIGVLFVNSKWFLRQSELIGHASEILVAGREGYNFEEYLEAEALRTYRAKAYKGVFDGYSLEQMKRALKSRMWIASILVAINALAIHREPKK